MPCYSAFSVEMHRYVHDSIALVVKVNDILKVFFEFSHLQWGIDQGIIFLLYKGLKSYMCIHWLTPIYKKTYIIVHKIAIRISKNNYMQTTKNLKKNQMNYEPMQELKFMYPTPWI